MDTCTKINNCVVCGNDKLIQFLNLGEQPLANDFHSSLNTRYPLRVNYCPVCNHSQLSHSVHPGTLFSHYSYVSGTTNTLREYFDDLATQIISENITVDKVRVLDIGCNDGTFISSLMRVGAECIGVDPSDKPVQIARSNNIKIYNDFWNKQVCKQIINDYGTIDIITVFNVLGHTPTPKEFLRLCKKCLSPNGVVYIQTSQREMFTGTQFDTVYHEHFSYFSFESIRMLAEDCGFEIDHVKYVPIHGQSMLCKLLLCKKTYPKPPPRYWVPMEIQNYQERANEIVDNYIDLVSSYEDNGYSYIAYGAAAKGTVFFNSANITPQYIVDDNVLKWYGHLPGYLDTTIYPPTKLEEEKDKKLLIAIPAWNFKDEIIYRARKYISNPDTRFVVWFPEIAVYDLEGTKIVYQSEGGAYVRPR